MLVLAIETATDRASVAAVEDGGELTAWREETHQDLCRRLAAEATGALSAAGRSFADVGLIAVGLGPGSFTSLRVGLATAKGVAFSRDIPLVGVPSFEAMAWQVRSRFAGLVCPIIDARRGEYYHGLYRVSEGAVEQVEAESVGTPAELAARLGERGERVAVIGGTDRLSDEDAARFGEMLHRDPVWPDAGAIAALGLERYLARGGDRIEPLRPIYVRKSYAEESLNIDLGLR